MRAVEIREQLKRLLKKFKVLLVSCEGRSLLEQHCEKTCFLHVRKQVQISCPVNAQLISAFVFAT